MSDKQCPLCGVPNEQYVEANSNVNTNIIECPLCCEKYEQSLKECPACGMPNEHYVEVTSQNYEEQDAHTIICPCCGEHYDKSLIECPVCGVPDESHTEETYEGSKAMLIDEDSGYETQTPSVRKSKKQEAPDGKMVLAAFIGIIIIVISLFVKAVSGIADKATSKIGAEIFNSQDYDYQQNSR